MYTFKWSLTEFLPNEIPTSSVRVSSHPEQYSVSSDFWILDNLKSENYCLGSFN